MNDKDVDKYFNEGYYSDQKDRSPYPHHSRETDWWNKGQREAYYNSLPRPKIE